MYVKITYSNHEKFFHLLCVYAQCQLSLLSYRNRKCVVAKKYNFTMIFHVS